VLGQHLVIINSLEIAHELLDRRGGIYSNRPRMVTFSEMYVAFSVYTSVRSSLWNTRMGWESIIVQMNPGVRWRKHRRTIQEKFSPGHVRNYAEKQKSVVYSFLAGLGKTPEKLRNHIKRQVAPSPTPLSGSH
jgi:cytochrome P450